VTFHQDGKQVRHFKRDDLFDIQAESDEDPVGLQDSDLTQRATVSNSHPHSNVYNPSYKMLTLTMQSVCPVCFDCHDLCCLFEQTVAVLCAVAVLGQIAADTK
jgi:hypothetical protein